MGAFTLDTFTIYRKLQCYILYLVTINRPVQILGNLEFLFSEKNYEKPTDIFTIYRKLQSFIFYFGTMNRPVQI